MASVKYVVEYDLPVARAGMEHENTMNIEKAILEFRRDPQWIELVRVHTSGLLCLNPASGAHLLLSVLICYYLSSCE